MKTQLRWIILCSFLFYLTNLAHAASYKYFRVGSKEDIVTSPAPGIAMMGGGSDLDEAFSWLCNQGNGGDFLILRATGDDDYNSYVNKLCKANSVATLIIPNRAAAEDPAVAEIIRKAEVIFIAGGDQANYIRQWQGTPVQTAINESLKAGKPIGGTSAGLAVEGDFIYSATGDKPEDKDLSSADVLRNPYFERVTLVRNFLNVPGLQNLLADSHFAKRDRMGRSLGFLSRIMKDGWSQSPREIAIDEKSAVLVEANGKANIVGTGKGAYFMRPTHPPEACEKGVPLTFRNVVVYRVTTGGHFDLTLWKGDGGIAYSLSVESGNIKSTQAKEAIY
ncbi:MAG TPA: cyanophycinase [Candidatus Sulfotelmatobacter sp.]|nr:cyanophycinase [Candidatus Sulfotelmatobacter sp.]